MTETGISVFVALLLALLLANPALNLARTALGEGFSINPLGDPVLMGAALVAGVLLTLFSGFYPAMLLSRIEPALAIRGNDMDKPGSFMSIRRGLVVFQFAISQVFIICTIIAMQQMSYFGSASLGYDTDAIVEFAVPTRDDGKIELLKDRLSQSSLISGATYSNSGATSQSTWASSLVIMMDDGPLESGAQVKLVDYDYIDVYGMNVIAGVDFVQTDSATGIIVNQTFVDKHGFDSPEDILGVVIDVWNWEALPITGVVQDFNTRSLHTEVEPTILIQTSTQAYSGAVKIASSQIEESLVVIKDLWESSFPDFLFEHSFLDETIAEMYEEEQATQGLIQMFALIAILIGCIGLFGLISYTTSQRAREVGIRKVLGASAVNIVNLFSKEFIVMVLLGFVISAPVAHFVMSRWLENFAYRIDIGVGVFLVSFALSLFIALATVGARTFQAAQANPVDTINR
jgi:ABC-type antimicrobial peptide transport system permease subunit